MARRDKCNRNWNTHFGHLTLKEGLIAKLPCHDLFKSRRGFRDGLKTKIKPACPFPQLKISEARFKTLAF